MLVANCAGPLTVQFGAIDIDSSLIRSKQSLEGVDIVESLNGCICCSVRADLLEALEKLVGICCLAHSLNCSMCYCQRGWLKNAQCLLLTNTYAMKAAYKMQLMAALLDLQNRKACN